MLLRRNAAIDMVPDAFNTRWFGGLSEKTLVIQFTSGLIVLVSDLLFRMSWWQPLREKIITLQLTPCSVNCILAIIFL